MGIRSDTKARMFDLVTAYAPIVADGVEVFPAKPKNPPDVCIYFAGVRGDIRSMAWKTADTWFRTDEFDVEIMCAAWENGQDADEAEERAEDLADMTIAALVAAGPRLGGTPVELANAPDGYRKVGPDSIPHGEGYKAACQLLVRCTSTIKTVTGRGV